LRHFGPTDVGHFGPTSVGPKCPLDTSDLGLKCLNSSHLGPKCRKTLQT